MVEGRLALKRVLAADPRALDQRAVCTRTKSMKEAVRDSPRFTDWRAAAHWWGLVSSSRHALPFALPVTACSSRQGTCLLGARGSKRGSTPVHPNPSRVGAHRNTSGNGQRGSNAGSEGSVAVDSSLCSGSGAVRGVSIVTAWSNMRMQLTRPRGRWLKAGRLSYASLQLIRVR